TLSFRRRAGRGLLLPGLVGLRVLLLVGRRVLVRELALQILGALPQLRLLARQLLELALQLFLGQLRAPAGQLLLLLEQLVLPPREIANLVERALRAGILGLSGGARLVVGLLGLLQLLVEERREIVIAARVPGARSGLLALDVALLDVGLRLQQVVERLH